LRALNIIVACDQQGGYAKKGKIPWSFKADWEWFKIQTAGSYCIMGRRTYEEILEKKCKRLKTSKALLNPEEHLLEDRFSIVLTKQDIPIIGAQRRSSLREALDYGCEHPKMPVFILGGYHLWMEAYPQVKKVYQTVIDHKYGCDRFFNVAYLNKNYKIVKGEGPKKINQKSLYWTIWEKKK